jgi:hypothetical protein
MLCLLLSLTQSPAQGGELELRNIRATYGMLGPTRPDGKILPGDIFHLAFDIENIQVSNTGEAQYGMAMEVTDANNKVQFKQDPVQLTALNTFGGRSLPAIAHVKIGRDQPPGKYTLKVTVTDRASKKSNSFSRPFEVAAPSFGIVQLSFWADAAQQISAPALAVPGQALWVHAYALDFKRGGTGSQPNLAIEMQVVDDKNQPTLPKPFTEEFTKLPAEAVVLPIDFQLVPNRPGKFTIKLRATDRVANKTMELSFPFTVIEPK